jgi:hypothetical protein
MNDYRWWYRESLLYCNGKNVGDIPLILIQCMDSDQNILDPVPVHRDENFWTLFQCTGTKIFGPCSSAQGRKFLDLVPRDVMEWSQESIVITFATFVSRICTFTSKYKFWRSKCSFNIQHWLKYRFSIEDGWSNSFTSSIHDWGIGITSSINNGITTI